MKRNKNKHRQSSYWRKNVGYKLFAIFMLLILLAPILVRVAQAVQ